MIVNNLECIYNDYSHLYEKVYIQWVTLSLT